MKKILFIFISVIMLIPTIVLAEHYTYTSETTNKVLYVLDSEGIISSSLFDEIIPVEEKLLNEYYNVYIITTTDDAETTFNSVLQENENNINVIAFINNTNLSTTTILTNVEDEESLSKINEAIQNVDTSEAILSLLKEFNNYYFDESTGDIATVDEESLTIDEKNTVTNYTASLVDSADILSEDEEKELLNDMFKITDYGNVLFYSVYSGCSSYSCSGEYGKSKFKSLYGENAEGTMYMIDMSARYLYIFSDGRIYESVNENMADSITEKYYKLATSGDYYKNAVSVFDSIYNIVRGEKFVSPMRYISAALLSLCSSSLILFLYTWMRSRVKPKKGQELLTMAKPNFTVSNPEIAFVNQTKVYSPSSSGGSGGSSGGGGGGGGGGSSGGGGGHGF